MLRLLWTLLGTVNSALRGHQHLVVENLVLRQQLTTFKVCQRRPRIRTVDRVFWVALRRLWSRWSDVLIIVKTGDRRALAPQGLSPLLVMALTASKEAGATTHHHRGPNCCDGYLPSPHDTAPRYLVFDRDSIFSPAVVGTVKTFHKSDPSRESVTPVRGKPCPRSKAMDEDLARDSSVRAPLLLTSCCAR